MIDELKKRVKIIPPYGGWEALAAEPRPPQLNWLINRLSAINSRCCSNERICFHAIQILNAVTDLRANDNRGGHDIDRGAAKIAAKHGMPHELARLKRIALRASNGSRVWLWRWQKSWAATSGATRRAVWKPKAPPVVKRWYDMDGKLIGFQRAPINNVVACSARGYSFLAPLPSEAVPLIEKACAELKERPRRKTNEPAADLASVLRIAYKELTGRVGVTKNNYPELGPGVKGGLIQLGRDVDSYFSVKITARLRPRSRRKLT